VLCILAEGKGYDALIDETRLSAISDLLLACPDIVEGSTSDLLASSSTTLPLAHTWP
jgi:hypothetical protein